ncbi:923_t:CDS:2 [Dentiscutata heterogama]|uniref:923_t:CDS:1 n=1 Tax=Dentiscutata heterogama TaxID=1316150 RepID=A0ACA9L6B2_9GLOM|nr:923_t:CDS:2 [Dentiscutata heterogama]
MKTSTLVILCLSFILLSVLIISISTESNLLITPNTTIYTNFTYTESTQNTTFSQSQLYAIDIQFYDDGTTLIHLVSDDPINSFCFEPIFRIRIIHLNGSVTEINPDLNLDSVNYCLFNGTFTGKMMNPISIRPLKQPFILVSYLNGTDYWGAVLNWNGEKLSSISLDSFTNFTSFTSLATADEGYAILYAKYSVNETNFMRPLGGLYASFIAYNKTSTGNPILLFQVTRTEMKINAVHCNALFGFCYYCVASIIYNNTVYYEEIPFCSETTVAPEQLLNTPNETSVPWSVSSTPIGGYVFSAVVNATCFIYIYDVDHYFNYSKVNLTYFNATGIGAYNILKNNNTFLFSLRETNSKNTTWSLLAVQLPKTPDCMHINAYL